MHGALRVPCIQNSRCSPQAAFSAAARASTASAAKSTCFSAYHAKKSRNTCLYFGTNFSAVPPVLKPSHTDRLPLFILNAYSRSALAAWRFRQTAPECSLYSFPQTALSVGDAVFLSCFPARVSFPAFTVSCILLFMPRFPLPDPILTVQKLS